MNYNKLVKVKKRPGEQWLKYSDSYLLSNYGRWYSVSRNKLLKQRKNNWGYLRAEIYDTDGRRINVFTHIQVIVMFGDINGKRLPDECETLRELGLSIDHISRNKRDNSIFNLELVSHQENCLRKYKTLEATS